MNNVAYFEKHCIEQNSQIIGKLGERKVFSQLRWLSLCFQAQLKELVITFKAFKPWSLQNHLLPNNVAHLLHSVGEAVSCVLIPSLSVGGGNGKTGCGIPGSWEFHLVNCLLVFQYQMMFPKDLVLTFIPSGVFY